MLTDLLLDMNMMHLVLLTFFIVYLLAHTSVSGGGNLPSSAGLVTDKTDALQPIIIGYRRRVCKRCLSHDDSLTIISKIEPGTKVFRTEHISIVEKLRAMQHIPKLDRRLLSIFMHFTLVEEIKKTINE
jgi:hypothetical protein